VVKNKELLYDLYLSPKFIRVIRSRRICRVDHVPCEGKEEVYTGFWLGDLMEIDHFKYLGVD
jgi:hypothetical protein